MSPAACPAANAMVSRDSFVRSSVLESWADHPATTPAATTAAFASGPDAGVGTDGFAVLR